MTDSSLNLVKSQERNFEIVMKYRKRTLSTAPMMDWTDRHCRVFHRQITQHTWLYTELSLIHI